MRLDELRQLNTLLTGANAPADVFMSLRDRSLRGDVRALALANELRRLQGLANPERFMGNPPAQDLAREIQARLLEWHAGALAALVTEPTTEPMTEPTTESMTEPMTEPRTVEAAIEAPAAWLAAGPGEEVAEPPRRDRVGAGFAVTAGANRYQLDGRQILGDIAAVHRGRGVAGPRAGLEVAAKVALDRADNGLILAEVEALRRLHGAEGAQRRQVPELLDLFQSGECAGVIMPWLVGFDGVTLRERFPGGLPPEHVIWIGRRLLSVAGFAHRQGLVHANIEPAHVIVRPEDHHVSLVDWCWSVVEPARTRQGFRVYNADYSAPEVKEKRPPLPAADLYSIGRCLLFFLGGDLTSGEMPAQVDDRLQRFVRYLTRPSPLQRAQDAWDMYAELERVRAAIHGPHRFREFVVQGGG